MTEQHNQSTAIAEYREPVAPAPALSVFGSIEGFEAAQRMVKALAASDMVPDNYRGNMGNCLVAMEVSQRTGSGILAVMQNLHVIQGRPSWSSSFIIAALNSCGRFSPLRFRVEERGRKSVPYEYWEGPKGQRQKKTGKADIHDRECVAWCYDRATGDVLEGPPVTMEMAVLEGWYTKNDSKWKTMPDLMLRYRAAAFFGRLYAPDVLMGMHTVEEVRDMGMAERVDIVAPGMAEPAPEPARKPANDDKPAATRKRRADSKPKPEPEVIDAEPAAGSPEDLSAAADAAEEELERMADEVAGEVIDGEATMVPPADDDDGGEFF